MNPDALMARYWLERERRQRGEHTGLRALAPVLTGIVSECHGEKVSTNRRGELICTRCNGVCDGQSWSAARAESQQGDGIRTMVVHETRTVHRDREDHIRAAEADRYLDFARLAALIEPRPPAMPADRWAFVLHAYGWYLVVGLADATRIGPLELPDAPWSESSVLRARDTARDVLRRRAIQPPRASRCWPKRVHRSAAILAARD